LEIERQRYFGTGDSVAGPARQGDHCFHVTRSRRPALIAR